MEGELTGNMIFNKDELLEKSLIISEKQFHKFSSNFKIYYWFKFGYKNEKLSFYFYKSSSTELFIDCKFDFNFGKNIKQFVNSKLNKDIHGTGYNDLGNIDNYFIDGKMDLTFTIKIKTEMKPPKTKKEPVSKILFKNGDEISDFTIVSKNGNLKVHTNILAYSSPVFKAMFEH
uniref:BTB domain-containing protein n=1 Tax=Panagrolaimus sp. JU765 TaxID=591449 RepID=A0AC34RLZ0_9BILA